MAETHRIHPCEQSLKGVGFLEVLSVTAAESWAWILIFLDICNHISVGAHRLLHMARPAAFYMRPPLSFRPLPTTMPLLWNHYKRAAEMLNLLTLLPSFLLQTRAQPSRYILPPQPMVALLAIVVFRENMSKLHITLTRTCLKWRY